MTTETLKTEMIDQQLSPLKFQEPDCIHVEDQQQSSQQEQEAKNTGLRSILKQMTSYPLREGDISKSKQLVSQKKSRTYSEFLAEQQQHP